MKDTRFKPGQSGNPAGRKPGEGKIAKLRAEISQHVPAIIAKLAEKALEGDTSAARLLLERAIPPSKPTEEATAFDLPAGSLTDQGKAVLDAVSRGELATGQGSALLSALGNLAKLVELDEMDKRLRALEQRAEQT